MRLNLPQWVWIKSTNSRNRNKDCEQASAYQWSARKGHPILLLSVVLGMTWFGFVPRHKLTIERIYRLLNWCCINNSTTNFHFKSSSCINKKKGNHFQGNLLETTEQTISFQTQKPCQRLFVFALHFTNFGGCWILLSPLGVGAFLDHCEAFSGFVCSPHLNLFNPSLDA